MAACRSQLVWATLLPILLLAAQAFAPYRPLRPYNVAPRRRYHPRGRTTLRMGLKVTIRIVGRKQGGEEWMEQACDMYLTRLKPSGLEIGTEWHKNDAALVKGVTTDHDKNTPVVLLDPAGTTLTSEKLTDNIYRWLEQGGSRLVFVIGGGTCSSSSDDWQLTWRLSFDKHHSQPRVCQSS
jgi:23S rRNA pseudoU1915 N3-methylase RlmH